MANAPNPSGGAAKAAKAAQPQPQPQSHTSPSPYAMHQLNLYQSQSSNSSILYPVAPSGRGFNPRPVHRSGGVALSSSVSNTSLAPSPSYTYRPAVAAANAVAAAAATTTADSHVLPHLRPASHMTRQHPSHHYPPLLPSAPNPTKGFPVTAQPQHKVASSPVSDSNGYKSARRRDDPLAVVRDRKVRISDGATLYSLCRSWLRNGYPDETQPQHGDAVRTLPRPLPIPAVDNQSAKEDGEEEETQSMEEDEVEEHVEDLSPEDLLKRHIERAKKVRARLREERLKRIARYKTRLALLLPTQTEQIRNDAAAGN